MTPESHRATSEAEKKPILLLSEVKAIRVEALRVGNITAERSGFLDEAAVLLEMYNELRLSK